MKQLVLPSTLDSGEREHMQGDEKWVKRPESAFGKNSQTTLLVIVGILLVGAAAGIYFLWHYINS